MLKRGLWNKKRRMKIQNLVTVLMKVMKRGAKQGIRRRRGQQSNKLRRSRNNLLLKFKKKLRNLLLLNLCLHWKRRSNQPTLLLNRLKACWLILILFKFLNLQFNQVFLKLNKQMIGHLLVFLNNHKYKLNLFKTNHGLLFKLQLHLFNNLLFKPLFKSHSQFNSQCNKLSILNNLNNSHLKCDPKL